jgi:cation diffusion facilitator CzcD-associated flavoprotein CzcO
MSSSGLGLEAARARYRAERDRRLRPEGLAQYRRTTGEFGYYADDPYTARAERDPVRDTVEAVVVGGGFGGLLAAAKLRQAGVESLRMIEEGGDFGGTWYWNRYPGIHCDIESYIYLPMLEELGYVPKMRYAPGEEIRQHAVALAKHFGLYDGALFQTRASELRWDEETERWNVRTDRGDEIVARYVVVSNGTLTRPKLPGIPGIESFRGHTFHTSRWDYGYTGGTPDGGMHKLADKRVAVVGTGATGIQVVPAVAKDAEQLYVFQRTPSTVGHRGNRPTDPGFAENLQPGWQQERMDNFLRIVSGAPVEEDLTRDGWTETGPLQVKMMTGTVDESIPAEERERLEELADLEAMNKLRARVEEIVEDPAVAELLKPYYRYICKRPTFSDLYLEAFNRPNVTLVDAADHGGITRMTENAVVVGDEEIPVDCVIFATGFEVGASGIVTGTLPVFGRGGKQLLQSWAESGGPRTLHGFYTHGFPNLFQLTSLQGAAAVNYVHILQEQATHIGAVIAEARRTGAVRVEPSAEAEAAWVETVHASSPDNLKFLQECTPGYYNQEGKPRPRTNSFGPGPVVFHELLRDWRANGGMTEVLVRA